MNGVRCKASHELAIRSPQAMNSTRFMNNRISFKQRATRKSYARPSCLYTTALPFTGAECQAPSHASVTASTARYCATRACNARIRPSACVFDTVASYIAARSAFNAVRDPPSRYTMCPDG